MKHRWTNYNISKLNRRYFDNIVGDQTVEVEAIKKLFEEIDSWMVEKEREIKKLQEQVERLYIVNEVLKEKIKR